MGVAAVHDPATLFTADVYGAWVTSGFWGVDNVLQPRTRHEAYDARTGCRQPDSPRWGTPGGHQSGLLRDTGPSRARDTPTKMDREDNRSRGLTSTSTTVPQAVKAKPERRCN